MLEIILVNDPGLGTVAWSALAIVSAGFSCASFIFHFHPFSSRSRVVRYQPPGISPSLAAYLTEGGRSERALAAGIISLSEQGYLSIETIDGSFRLTRLPASQPPPAKEEAALVDAIFGKMSEWADDRPLRLLADDFRTVLDEIACPELLSPHSTLWLIGTTVCIVSIPLLFLAGRASRRVDFSLAFLGYVCLFVGIGIVSLKAALRAWPATLKKLRGEFLGGLTSRLRFTVDDLNPLFLTFSAVVGFGLLALVSTFQLSLFVLIVVIVSFVFRSLLESPSRKGTEILAQLEGFREFLSRTESDRLSREVPDIAHPPGEYGAYAVALNVEKGWREQFTGVLMERIEFERVCDAGTEMPPLLRTHLEASAAQHEHPFIELDLRGRK